MKSNGTGLALFDFDNDQDLDLFVVNAASLEDFSSGPGCRLYENTTQSGSITFVDVTDRARIDLHTWANGVAVGDANGDGFDDLYVTCHGPNVLLLNNGDGTFRDETKHSGVGDERWGTSASFGDLDGDGDLDLYVCNYVEFDPMSPPPVATYKGETVLGGPHGMVAQQDVVYENVGDGMFRDVTALWNLDGTPAFSLNVAILDFNNDGLQDIFVGNDSMSNNLFVNTGENPTRFEDRGLHSGIAMNGDGAMQATMGIGIADVNGNGRPDVFTTNFSSDTNTLHINDASGFFDDRTRTYGLGLSSRTMLGWTCGFHDFDLDGDEDLLIVNGHVYPQASNTTMDSQRSQPMLSLERRGNRFVQLASTDPPFVYRDRAAVFGDLDNDGDIDVIIAQRNGEVRVLQNTIEGKLPLTIRLEGDASNPKGLGASIRITLDDGTVVSRWNHDGAGFQSSMSTPITVSIEEGKQIQHIQVMWSDGSNTTVEHVASSGDLIIQKNKRTGVAS